MGVIKNWNIEDLPAAVSSSSCLNDVLRFLNVPLAGGNFGTIKKWIKNLNLDTSHFNPNEAISKNLRIRNKIKYTKETVLIENSNFSKGVVKKLAKQFISYECSDCGNVGIHNNKPLVLQLDHKNGIRTDNRIENLRWMCPNCHSQTPTFAGKNVNNASGRIKKRNVG